MPALRFLSTLCVLSAFALPLHAQDGGIDVLTHTPPRVYEGQMVVRVRTTSQAQLDALLEIARDVWSERTGVGVLEVAIHRDDRPRLASLGIPSDVLIADLQAYVDAGRDRIVTQTQLEQTQLEQTHGDQNPRGALVHDEQWFTNYRQLHEIEAHIQNIADLRPDLASVQTIGQSWEGRDIRSITISGPDAPGNMRRDRPAVFIFSTVHAREWIAPMTTCYIASRLAHEYASVPRVTALLDQARIIVVPIGNPDGYLFTWSDQRFWRNTRRDNGDGTFGVNINRNWGYEWGNQGSSSNTYSTNYRGAEPFSEPETRALRDVALNLGDSLVAHIDYHSYSQLIMWPFGYELDVITPEPAASIFEMLATEMATTIDATTGAFYDPIQSVDLYPAAGISPDWFFGELGKTSYTIELRPIASNFDPPPSTIRPCATENYQAFKDYIERTIAPVTVWDDAPARVLAGQPHTLPVWATSGLTFTDTAQITLHARVGDQGPFEQSGISHDGSGYAAMLPPAHCGEQIEYYFTATTDDAQTATTPLLGPDGPRRTLAQSQIAIINDTFESDTGWIVGADNDTATEGIWTRMDPQGTDAQPEDDHTTEGALCWVTDGVAGAHADDRDVDGGFTSLISPRFDATTAQDDLELSFWYWHTTSGVNPDPLSVRLSNNDGQTWVTIDFLYGVNNQWSLARYPIPIHIEPTDQMRVRFQAIDNFTDNTMEVAIDDLRVGYIGCAPGNAADLNGDGRLNFFDVSLFLTAFAVQDPIADFTNDGDWNSLDLSAFLTIFSAGNP